LVKEQAATKGHGRVMVVDGGGSLRRALLGDMIAANAVKNGWSGLVIYGCIRDCDEIAALDLGVKALNTIPVKTDKRGIGDLNVPVTFAGQTISPDDWIYCDNNGIVVAKNEL
jgi:regulator of ribonuclease activity A